jgi:hypothetical protein
MAFADFDAVVATTLKNYLPKLEDNVFSARPLVFFLKQAGQIRTIAGGTTIVLPLIYAQNTTAGSYAGYDVIPTTPQDGMSAAEFTWKEYAASISISGREEAINNSEQEVIDLLEAKTMQTEETILEQLDQMFFLDGTGNGGKNFLGLAHLVGQNATVVGGIDPAAQTWWQSNINTTAEVLTKSRMENSYNTASVGNDRPNVVLTTQALYEKYNTLLQDNLRYTDTRTADAGFENLVFHAAPVTYDVYCQANTMYMLNSKYLRLTGHSDVWFKSTPFVRPENQNARYAQILLMGELGISNRKRHSVLQNKTAV